MPKRNWVHLGNTTLDFSTVVKIVFDSKSARLFIVGGESLLITAWSENRAEVSRLKQLASLMEGWISVRTEPDDPEALDQRLRLNAVDKIVTVEAKGGTLIELFIDGVFAGQVLGEGNMAHLQTVLGAE